MSIGYFVLLCRELEHLDFMHFLPAAMLQAMYANAHQDPDNRRTFEPIDFMPGWEKSDAKRIATVDELITLFGAQRANAG